jgi:hypothetical protein
MYHTTIKNKCQCLGTTQIIPVYMAYVEQHLSEPVAFTNDLSVLISDWWEVLPDSNMGTTRRYNATARAALLVTLGLYVHSKYGTTVIGQVAGLLLTIALAFKPNKAHVLPPPTTDPYNNVHEKTAAQRTRNTAIAAELPGRRPILPSMEGQIYGTRPHVHQRGNDMEPDSGSVGMQKYVSRQQYRD